MMREEMFRLELHEKSTTVVFQGVDTWHDISNIPLQHDGTEMKSTVENTSRGLTDPPV